MFGLDTQLPDIHLCTHHHFIFKSESRSCRVFQGDLKLWGFSELPSIASRVTRTVRIYYHYVILMNNMSAKLSLMIAFMFIIISLIIIIIIINN